MNPEEKGKITPSTFMAVALDDISRGIRKIENYIEEGRLEGINEAYDLTITTSRKEIRPPAGKKWHAVSVLNRGSADVLVGTNVGWANMVTIPKNGFQNLDMKRGIIEFVRFKTESGTASITFNGLR